MCPDVIELNQVLAKITKTRGNGMTTVEKIKHFQNFCGIS